MRKPEKLNKEEKESLRVMHSCPSPEIVSGWIKQRHLGDYTKK